MSLHTLYKFLFLILLSYFVLSHSLANSVQADLLPEKAKTELLKGNWSQVFESLQEIKSENWNSIFVMVAAHAGLATNRNNDSLLLFMSASEQDLDAWLSWSKELLSHNQMNPVPLYLLGDALARKGHVTAAESCFTEALGLDSGFGLAWVARGAMRSLMGNTDEAYLDLMQAIIAEPSLADAYASLGCLEIMLRNAEGAEDAFNKALNLNPEFALAHNGRGCARYGLGRPDEASLDFDIASVLCPALVITEANRTFVLTMVAQKIDENLAKLEKPGIALVTRSQVLPSGLESIDFTNLKSTDEVFALADRYGYEPIFQAMALQKQDYVMRNKNLWQSAQQFESRILTANENVVSAEKLKVLKTAGTAVFYIVTGNVPGLVSHGVTTATKNILSKTAERHLPKSASEIFKTELAMIGKNNLLTSFDVAIQLIQNDNVLNSVSMQSEFSNLVRDRDKDINRIKQISNFEKALALQYDIKKAADDGFLTNPSSVKSAGMSAIFSSSQPWSQMIDLYRETSSKKPGYVVILEQDHVKSFAFQLMMNRAGICTTTIQSLNTNQLENLSKVLGANSIVGFKWDEDNIKHMMNPPPWLPPGGGGGMAAFSVISGQKDISNSSPLPSTPYVKNLESSIRLTVDLLIGPRSASTGFEALRPWMPKGNVGGVRTEDLDWIFVDKGDWPVMTFFSLLYEPPKETELYKKD